MRSDLVRRLAQLPGGASALNGLRALKGRWMFRPGRTLVAGEGAEGRAPRLRVVLPSQAPEVAEAYCAVSPCIEMALGGDSVGEPPDYVYAPTSIDSLLTSNQLANAMLCLAHRSYDFVVVSGSLAELPELAVAGTRDATILSTRAWAEVEARGRLPCGVRGRVLRILPVRDPAAQEQLATPAALGWGRLESDGPDLWVRDEADRVPPLPALRGRTSRIFRAPEDARPIVFVLSIFMAVGGVERNLIEVMRRLGDRYRFVVLTTERVSPSTGSLNHQCLPYAEALFDLGELVPQQELLDLIALLRRDRSPGLLFVCNGSPWLLANARAIRALFRDLAIVDQQVYDTREGWIAHYGDPGIQSFDRFVAINRGIRQVFLDRYAIDPAQIDLIYHAIDDGRFNRAAADRVAAAPDSDRYGLHGERRLFVQVGRLVDQKQPLRFLELARRARDEGLDDRFLLVGDGELAAACDAMIEHDALDNVRRIAYCDDMGAILPFADGLVVTSRFEGLPVVVLEALAMGVPVLSTDVGEIRPLLERYRVGSIVAAATGAGAAEALLAAFLRWRAALGPLRERACAAAPEIERRFSAQSVAEQYDRSWRRARAEVLKSEDSQVGSSIGRFASKVEGDVPSAHGLADDATGLASISVVIPTYNRCDLLLETLHTCLRHAEGLDVEFVVVDDGSEDETPVALEKLASETSNFLWKRIPNGGPGQARNVGAAMATRDVVLFMGDDIRPASDAFFRVHGELHARRPSEDLAVLGKAVWSSDPSEDINFVMAHVQGRGGEQFGYADLRPFSFLDWRFFYTANVSVKRTIVADWTTQGFSKAFVLAAYEDAEFAYRMMERRDSPLQILYAPASVGTHHHPFTVDAFMNRQTAAGMMAKVFSDLHTGIDVRDSIGMGGIHHAITQPLRGGGEADLADYMSVVEGLKSWARLVESRMNLGAQYWHDDLLKGVFAVCYLQGYVLNWSAPGANYQAAYHFILDEFARQIEGAVHTELAATALARMDSGHHRVDTRLTESRIRQSALWQWARRKPALYRIYQVARQKLNI